MQAAASQAGISAAYQFKLEGGFVRTPSPRVLHRLSGVLDLPYPALMRLAGYSLETDVTPSPGGMGAVRDLDSRAEREEGGVMSEPAPTNRRVMRLLEEIRRDLTALREDVRRLGALGSAAAPQPSPPPRDRDRD
jgi:transcriptional regulator with XRE-family HTH domain